MWADEADGDEPGFLLFCGGGELGFEGFGDGVVWVAGVGYGFVGRGFSAFSIFSVGVSVHEALWGFPFCGWCDGCVPGVGDFLFGGVGPVFTF